MKRTPYQLLQEKNIIIKRARGCYLYTADGKRFLDLCLDGGRSVLGRKVGKSQLIFKNLLEQGGVSALPSVQLHRLERAVAAVLVADNVLSPWVKCLGADSSLFILDSSQLAVTDSAPVYMCVRCYKTPQQLFSALLRYEQQLSGEKNPVLIKSWMPFLPETIDPELLTSSWALSLPNPFAWAEAPYIGVFVASADSEKKCRQQLEIVPDSENFSAACLGGTARAFDDLRSEMLSRTTDGWGAFDRWILPYWNRCGAWLYPKIAESEYSAFVEHCLLHNILISPDYAVPSVVPYGAGSGELKRL